MKSILKDTIERYAPFVTKRVKGKKSHWMSKEVKRHINIRDQLYRKAPWKFTKFFESTFYSDN